MFKEQRACQTVKYISTCLNMVSINETCFPRILFMGDLLIFVALLLPPKGYNSPQTPLLPNINTGSEVFLCLMIMVM